MSDPDRTRQREHWQAIAEQLGLSSEPEVMPSGSSTPASSEKRIPEPPSKFSQREERQEEASSPAEKESLIPVASQGRESSSVMPEPVKEPERPEVMPPLDREEEASTYAEDRGERSAKTRRGRRGRGPRDKGSVEGKEGEAHSQEELLSAEPAGRKAARPSRRGGGQGRGRKERFAVESDKPPGQPREKEPAPPADNEDDDADDLSSLKDWNVPSWNELIASLYRPER
jgi:hypothetical protein